MFGFGIDKKTLYIIIGILVVISLLSYGTDGIISLLLSIQAVLIAITVHEFGHAFGLSHRISDKYSIMCQTGAGRVVQRVDQASHNYINEMYN